MTWLDNLKQDFYINFIQEDRWRYLTSGLGNTLRITFFAVLLGICIGIIIAIIRSSYDKNRDELRGLPRVLLSIGNAICHVYLAVIRGTPVVVQLMIIYYIIFSTSRNGVGVATLAFGINSGAYVAENIRAGILSVDIGQTEAGLALGLPYRTTMLKIVIPQAIKNVIPAIGNELIALIKETSIVSMIGMFDLTNAAKIIGSGNNMASYIVPMAVVALFYLAIVYLLTFIIKIIEKKLRASDRR